jgi:glycosyltransferase involved in cell wall biosynthesis
MNQKPPKVCFVTSFFYPTLGGVETHIQNTAKELIKLGYDCEAYVSDMDRDKRIPEKKGKIDGIKIKRFRSWIKFSFSGILFPGLFPAISKSDADIFHIHGYRHPFNFIFWFTRKPVFITPHWPVYKGQRAKWAQLVVDFLDKYVGKYMFNHFSKVCVVTDLETPWVKTFNKKHKDIILTPNCIPDYYFKDYNPNNFRKKYNLKKQDLAVVTVSRLHPSKGIDQLVKTAKHFPKVKFIIMGKDGGFQKDLEKLIKTLSLKNIIITGEVTEEEKLEAYAGADIFCSPSHYEAFCISILEAMSQGCAVLTSDAGGMPWVVGKEGLTFKDYNLDDFKNQLNKLITNKKLREKFQKQGKIKAQNFKWKNTAETLDREYKRYLKPQ